MSEQPDPVLTERSRPVRADLNIGVAGGNPGLLQDLLDRLALGEQRYGVELHSYCGRDLLRDAYEEALDGYIYLNAYLSERSRSYPLDAEELRAIVQATTCSYALLAELRYLMAARAG
mgnify:CR=1 FL=1